MISLQNGQVFTACGRNWTARHVPENDDADIVIADPHATVTDLEELQRIQKINGFRDKKGLAEFPVPGILPFPVVLIEEIQHVDPLS